MTLREELGVGTDPDFDLELPPGWSRQSPDEASLRDTLAKVRERCMREHQPQVYAEMKSYLERSYADMQRAGVFAFFSPTDADPDTLALPASINASIRRADPGQSLDDLARALIRDQGAQPLLGDPRTLRFETENVVRLGTQSLVNHSAVYLTPIPGSHRRRALALVAGFARMPDSPADSEAMQSTRFLFDACVSTLRWTPPVVAPGA